MHAHAGKAGSETVVVVGSEFSLKIGMEEQTFAAGRDLLGGAVENFICAGVLLLRIFGLTRPENVAVPFVGRSACAAGRAGIPQSGDYVAVIKELKVIYRVIGYRANAARRGELNRGIALLDCAGCVDLKNRVRRADDDRSFYGKPGFFRRGENRDGDSDKGYVPL